MTTDTWPAWQPIETAPRDGRLLLVWWPEFAKLYGHGATVVAAWRDDMYWQAGNYHTFGLRNTPPSHWLPLPPPPNGG